MNGIREYRGSAGQRTGSVTRTGPISFGHLAGAEGIVTASVTLDPVRKTREVPRTYGSCRSMRRALPACSCYRRHGCSGAPIRSVQNGDPRARLAAGREHASVAVSRDLLPLNAEVASPSIRPSDFAQRCLHFTVEKMLPTLAVEVAQDLFRCN